jgi:polysaccharide transporter, PST family
MSDSAKIMRRTQAEINQAILDGPGDQGGYSGAAARGTIAAFSGQITRMVLQIGSTAIMSRLLTPGDFGLVAMAATVTAFVGIFTDMGLSGATIQKREITQNSVSTLFWLNLVVGLVLLGVTVALAPLAASFYDEPRIGPLVMWLGLSMPLAAAAAQHSALLSRAMRWIPIQVIGVLSQLAGVIGGIVAVLWFDMGYMALVVQGLSASIVSLILMWSFCRWRPSFTREWRSATGEMKYGANVTGFSLLNFFHRDFDNILIGNRWGAVELGYYNRAYNLLMMPIYLVNNSVGQSAVPILSRMTHDDERWNRAYLVMATATTFFGTLICVNLFAASQPLIRIVLGPQWDEVNRIFEFLAFSCLFSSFGNSGGWVFLSKGATKQYFRWAMFASPLFVLSFVIGLPWKAQGVAFAYAVCMALTVPLYHEYALRQTTIRRRTLAMWIAPIFVIAFIAMALGKLTSGELMATSPALAFFGACGVSTLFYLSAGLICMKTMAHYRPLADAMHERIDPLIARYLTRKPAT